MEKALQQIRRHLVGIVRVIERLINDLREQDKRK